MLRKKRQRLGFYSLLIDLVFGSLLLFATFVFLQLYPNIWEQFLQRVTSYPFEIETVYHLQGEHWFFVVVLGLMIVSLQISGFYRYDHHSRYWVWILAAARGILMGVALIALCIYFLNLTRINRSLIFLFAALFSFYLPLKTLLWNSLLRYRERSGNPLTLILVGSEAMIEKALVDFDTLRDKGTKVLGYVSLEGKRDEICEIQSLGCLNDLSKTLTQKPVDAVCFLASGMDGLKEEFLKQIEETGVELWYFLPRFFANKNLPQPEFFAEKPLLLVSSTSHYEDFYLVKRSFDIIGALVALILFSPLMLGLAILIKMTSGGSVFYRQERTGFKGRPFLIYKFRTMRQGAENNDVRDLNTIKGPVFKAKEDPRVTPLGKWMRRFSLDELPQFINVLGGTMSLVGPRPLPIEETQAFEAFRDHRRYRVLPGITGLWQVSGRASLEDFEEWIQLDLYYIDHWSLFLDLKILVKTIPAVISGKGAG